MKKYFAIFIITIASTLSMAQVIIGDQTKASPDQSNILLDFEKNAGRGLLLPTVAALPATPVDGTILLDATTATTARIKLRANNAWIDLSTIDGNATSTRPSVSDKANTKAVIGAETSNADGVLVLESTTKAMVLPTVDNTDKIVNPSPGMMVYINSTSAAKPALAVFNGTNWTFWSFNKPVITIDPPTNP